MLSVVLVTIALSAWWLQKKLTGNQDVTSITGKPTENMGADAGGFTLPVVALLALTGFIAVILPGASMALSGVLGTLSGGVTLANLTTSHYAALFSQQGDALSALGTYGFSLGNMISLRHQRNGLETMTTNAWAMLYGTLVMGAIALIRGDDFTPVWSVSYMGALLYLALFGSVIAFGAYFTLVGRIGAGKAAYSTLLFPLVALSFSTVYEGYVWHSNGIAGLLLILTGNLVMFARPENWFKRLRMA